MVLYICIIVFASVLLVVINALFGLFALNLNLLTISLWTVLGVVLSIALDGVAALLVRAVSSKINIDSKFFAERKGERKFYMDLNIKKWKDSIPEMGKVLKFFDKTTVPKEVDGNYFKKFILETCLAEVMHVISILLAPLLIIILPIRFALRISLPIVLVNIFLNILPVMVQRYNRPKLRIAYSRQLKKEESNKDNIIGEIK